MKKSPLSIIFLVVFIDLVGFGIVIPILPYYAEAYGASATVLGWLMMSYSLMQFFFAPIWGRLSDRIGRRPVLLGSMAGLALSMLMLGLAPSLLWLFIARTFAGICGANVSTATAYIADITTEEDRAKGMGIIGAAFGLGFIFGPVIGGLLSRYGFGVPMFAAATLSVGNILFAYFKLPEPPRSQAAREAVREKRFDLVAIRGAMGDARTRMAVLLLFVATLALTQMEVTLALFTQKRHGFDAQATGWLLAFMGVVMVIVQGGLIGKLSKRFGETRLVLVGTIAMAIALVLMAQASAVPTLVVGMGLLAFGNGITNPSLSSLASKGALPGRQGATMGVFQSAGSLARVVGPPVAGIVYDTFGIARPLLVAAGLMVFAFWAMAMWQVGSSLRISDAVAVLRASGVKGLVKTYGWKVVAAVVVYYLIRDITLYILIPWLVAEGILSL
jgi:multidrug resistance protein